jgi:hypothetical protein
MMTLRVPTRMLVAVCLSATLAATLAACGAAGDASGDPAEDAEAAPGTVPVLEAQATPSLEIGVMEGDPNYSFDDVVGTLHLASGNIAVADGGAEQISLFAPDGTFIRHVGGRGEGPGEFSDLVRLYASGSDSIWAAEGMMRRVLVFDSSGSYARQFSALDVSADSVFALDSWLHGRYWIEGGLRPAERAPVRAALDALPEPTTAPGFRMVRIAEDGRLWIREAEVSASGTRIWTIVEPSGRPTSMIELPAQLDPLEIGRETVTGRWRGESDVNFVRTYAFSPGGETRAPPAWIMAPSAPATGPAPTEDEFLLTIRNAIRGMAMAEEMHYASHMTYTAETDSLDWERPDGVEVTFIQGNARAWSAAFTHPAFDRVCALAYGFDVPAGWQPGRVVCAPARSTAGPAQSR